MRATRRGFLLGSASALGLAAFGSHASPLPTGHDPALDAITAAVRSFTSLLHPYPLGVDVCDFRAVTRAGCGLDGLAGYGEATVRGPEGSGRARLAAALALKQMQAVYGGP